MSSKFAVIASILVAAIGLSFTLPANAEGTVVVNGSTFVCENSCVVSFSNGSWFVTDSGGGFVFLVKTRIVRPGN